MNAHTCFKCVLPDFAEASHMNGFFQVVAEYRTRGMEFVLQAINQPAYLEDLTGLTELMKSAISFQVDWDDEIEDDATDI